MKNERIKMIFLADVPKIVFVDSCYGSGRQDLDQGRKPLDPNRTQQEESEAHETQMETDKPFHPISGPPAPGGLHALGGASAPRKSQDEQLNLRTKKKRRRIIDPCSRKNLPPVPPPSKNTIVFHACPTQSKVPATNSILLSGLNLNI